MNIAPHLAQFRVAELQAEADARRLAKRCRALRQVRPRLSLRALFVRLRLA